MKISKTHLRALIKEALEEQMAQNNAQTAPVVSSPGQGLGEEAVARKFPKLEDVEQIAHDLSENATSLAGDIITLARNAPNPASHEKMLPYYVSEAAKKHKQVRELLDQLGALIVKFM